MGMIVRAKEMYPEYWKEAQRNDGRLPYGGPSDYNPVLRSFGYKLLIQEDQKDYQGDSWILYEDEDNGNIGYLCFGWGSCSGCDSLQACETMDEIDHLAEYLDKQIKWYPDRKSALEFFRFHAWEHEYAWGFIEFRRFIERCKKYLFGGLRVNWQSVIDQIGHEVVFAAVKDGKVWTSVFVRGTEIRLYFKKDSEYIKRDGLFVSVIAE